MLALPLRPVVVWLGVVIGLGSSTAHAQPVEPQRAAAFKDSVGVNTHVSYFDTAYDHWDVVIAKLAELGVDHARDGLFGNPAPDWHDWNEQYFTRLRQAGDAGIRFTYIAGRPGYHGGTLPDLIAALKGPLRGTAEAVEGPNEYDNAGVSDWAPKLRDYQTKLYRAVKSDKALAALPVLGPSFVHDAGREQVGDLSSVADFGNLHPYTGGKTPNAAHLDRQRQLAAAVTAQRPLMATEAGFHNAVSSSRGQPAVDEGTAANYSLRTVLEHFRSGISRTFLYELIDQRPNPTRDEPEDHFGLLRNDLSEKPAFVALKNLLTLAGGNAGGALAPLDLSITSSAQGSLRSLLLQDGPGVYRLALWREEGDKAPGDMTQALSVTVRAPSALVAGIGRPLTSGRFQPTARRSEITLRLGGEPIVLAVTGHGDAPAAGGRLAPRARQLARKVAETIGRRPTLKNGERVRVTTMASVAGRVMVKVKGQTALALRGGTRVHRGRRVGRIRLHSPSPGRTMRPTTVSVRISTTSGTATYECRRRGARCVASR